MTDLTDDVRAEIARLCGLVEHPKFPGYWRDPNRADEFEMVSFPKRDWLVSKWIRDEALWESLLLRGLGRAGVLVNLYWQSDHEWRACYVDSGAFVFESGPTPLAAMVALAAAHLDARKDGEK